MNVMKMKGDFLNVMMGELNSSFSHDFNGGIWNYVSTVKIIAFSVNHDNRNTWISCSSVTSCNMYAWFPSLHGMSSSIENPHGDTGMLGSQTSSCVERRYANRIAERTDELTNERTEVETSKVLQIVDRKGNRKIRLDLA